MKNQHTKLNRLLSLVMVIAMILTMVPITAVAAGTPSKLYLKPNSNWLVDGARFAAYFFGNGEKWVSMTDANEDGLYEAIVPSGYPNVIFCRMNPGATDNNWNNKWNQTADLTVPTDGTNCYTVNAGTWDNGGGTWSTVSELYCINSLNWEQVKAYAWTDSPAVDWPGADMTKTGELVNGFDVYSVTFDAVYQNIIFNNNNNGGQTADLTLNAGQYYDLKTGAWYTSPSAVPAPDLKATEVYLVGEFNGWSNTADEFRRETDGGKTAKVSLELAANTGYEFKIINQGAWTSCATAITDSVAGLSFTSSVGDNCSLTTKTAGTYVFTYDTEANTLSVSYPKAVYTVTFSGSNVTSNGADSVTEGDTYTATLTPADGYDLPEAVTVTGGTGEYNKETGALSVINITGNVTIQAAGVKKADKTLYLKPSGNWLKDGARFAAYFFNNTTNASTWVPMTDAEGDLIFEVVVPNGYPNVIFCRMNPGTTENKWENKYNQSADLTIPTDDKNQLTVPEDSWDGFSTTWSVYAGPQFPQFTIAGSIGASNWTPENGEKLVNDNGIFTYTYTGVKAGEYGLKVTIGNWNASWPQSDYALEVGEDNSSVTVNFDPATKQISHTVTPPATYTVTFNGTGVTSDGASSVKDGAEYVAKLTAADGYDLPETVTVTGGTGEYNKETGALSVTNITGDVTITAVGVKLPMTLYFQNNWLWTDVRAFYWGGSAKAMDWPGEPMTFVEKFGGYDVYKVVVPGDVEGVIFNGVKNDGSGNRDQTPDIVDAANGDTYCMLWDNGNKVEKIEFTPSPAPTVVDYEVTFHFANTLGWGAVNLYTWLEDTTTVSGAWPGSAVSQDGDGFYTMTVKYKAPEGQGLNFIFNNGSSQTHDLSIPASEFTDNKAEKWVVLTTLTDGKYKADILANGDSIAISPIVKDSSVTFKYKAASATKVEVRGTMCGWEDGKGVAMTKNAYGVWSVTLNDVAAGIHEYKFVVDGNWVTDPANTWTENGNSAFLISDPSKDINKVTIIVHYNRADGNYTNWNLYMWNENGSKQYDFTPGEGEVTTTIEVDGRATQSVNFKVRKSVGANKWAAEEGQVTVNLSTIVSGTIHVYTGGKYTGTQTLENDVVFANKISDVQYDYEQNTVTVYTNKSVQDPENAFGLVKDDTDSAWTYDSTASTGGKYVFKLTDEPQLSQLYRYKVRFYEQAAAFHTVNYDIGIDSVYASDKFAAEFTYTGSDLGATYTGSATTFRLWAPTAESVDVKLYSTGSDLESGAAMLGTYAMSQDVNGTWVVTVQGELKNVYYTYSAKVGGETVEAADPYAQATGVNGLRSMIIDLDSTDPADWDSDSNPNPVTSQTDAVIYELHVRDFSIDDSSGITEANRGKFLAFTEKGTTVSGEGKIATGIDYLADLGITHLHLLPIYDYASVDETTCSNFNWGYDPQNYNVPEGSYSTNPYDGNVRVNEMKQMVKALHDNGISVVMDVVYNHVYDAETFSYNVLVPGYFSRVDSNRSGCGNDTASEREMVRKYIVESVLYWTEEYHIDGFRFDLVGLIDVETINQIVAEVHAIRPDVIFYGEGWDMDDTNKEPGTEMAKQGNASKTPGFAYFSDSIRNLLGGDNGKSTGFVSGSANREGEVVSNVMANPWWTTNPQQVIQYASCHDNYTLADKLIISTGRTAIDGTVMKMSNLAAAVYMTAQGVPFIHAGEELFREKLDENGRRSENSYNASDYVNHIDWSDLEKTAYAANVDYYKGLIALRKAHPALRLATAAAVKANVYNQQASGNVVSFWIDGRDVAGETHDSIYIIYNANSSARTIELPAGSWDVLVSGTKAGTTVLKSVSGTVSVEGISAMVLVQEESTQEPTGPAPKSDYALTGSFNDWNHSNFMAFQGDSTTVVTSTLSLPAGTYEFKVKQGDNWYGNNGTIEDTTKTTSATGWDMATGTENCKLKATGGSYTFIFDTTTKKLIIEHDPNGGDFGDPDEYYLAGWINGVDYALGFETGDYKFVDGKVTTTFTSDSYVFVKNGDSSEKYMTDTYQGAVATVTMYDTAKYTSTQWDKMLIPGGAEVTITMVNNGDGTITLGYTTTAAAVEDTSGIQQGVTLHCWNWSFAEIEKQIPTIAAQGYTAIQTSPVQAMKEPTNLANNTVGSHWWVYYQPVDFVITTDEGNALGTKAELASMVATAHRYGVKVIVDVVANHLGNKNGNDLAEAIPQYLRNQKYWHDIATNTTDYTSRFDMTQHCMGGLPDLNTSNSDVQGFVLQFLKECVDVGVDGFRFDAAKHIETPKDDSTFASQFWPVVIDGAEDYAKDTYNKDLYIYGELLDDPAIAVSAYTQYMAVTDNGWGNHLRSMVVNGTATMTAGYYKSAPASALVIWAESHDTFATDDQNQSSANVSEADIIKTWALVAARADAMGLYLARPESTGQALGVASVTGWADKTVKAINLFHNAFVGQSEKVSNENGISYVERGTTGAVLVKMSARTRSTEVSVTAHNLADGTYTDQISGNTFTVANGKITGQMDGSGIAVLSNEQEKTYNVTVEAGQGGQAAVDNNKPSVGQTVTVTVKADDGKVLEKLTVTDESGKEVAVTDKSNGTYTFIQIPADVKVTATFRAVEAPAPVKYTVTVETATGGKVTADKTEATAGETVTVTVKADDGKVLDKLTVTDESGKEVSVTDKGNGTYTFTQVAADVMVAATFRAVEAPAPVKHAVKVETATGGKVTADKTEATAGETVTVTVKADSGKAVDKVTVTDEKGKAVTVKAGSNGTYTFTQPDASVTVKVTFKTAPATPATGDSSPLMLVGILMMLSALAALALLELRRRKTI